MLRCPYCRSDDVAKWRIETKKITYRCYTCGELFEERNTKDCGKQIFKYGDNYPKLDKPFTINLSSRFKDHAKFQNMGKVPKAKKDDIIDLWIDLWEFMKGKIKRKSRR